MGVYTMDSFLLALNVVFPLLVMMAAGALIRRAGMIDQHTIDQLNRVLYKLLLPLMLFVNTYKLTLEEIFNPLTGELSLAIIACDVIVITLLVLILPKVVHASEKCGVMIQGFFRSNLILFGIPIYQSVYGDGNLAMITVLVALIIPAINIMSVIVLEIFNPKSGQLTIGKLLRGIVKNPLVQGPVFAVICIFLHIRIPLLLSQSLSTIGSISTPLAFIVLGASLKLGSIKRNWRYLLFSVAGKLYFMPFVLFVICLALGMRNHLLVMVLGAMASPTAISSFAMAKEAGGDADLAAEIVALGSACSIFTIFTWVFFLKQFHFI